MRALYRCCRCGALVPSDCCDKCPSGEDGRQHDPGQAYAPEALAERDLRNEVAAEADRIETAYGSTAPLALQRVALRGVIDLARMAQTTGAAHTELVAVAAWAMVALRAEAREQAKGGGT